MEIDKRNRSELKAYFVKNALPTQGNFSDFIDAVFNQKDDGLVKLSGDPLSIEAVGDATSQKKAINFYESFADAGPAWVLSLNPRTVVSDPETARAGFSIGDGAGNSRLFIDRATGNVGVGTTAPNRALSVNGALGISDGLFVSGAGTSSIAGYLATRTVYFSAYVDSNSQAGNLNPMPMRNVSQNEGGGWNTSTSKFTAPVAGVYIFTMTALALYAVSLSWQLMVNSSFANQAGGGETSEKAMLTLSNVNTHSSRTVILKLNVNDQVYVKQNGTTGQVDNYRSGLEGALLVATA